MPTYTYYCEECDVEHEIIKSIFHFDREEYCNKCKNKIIRKIKPNQSGFKLKGPGFHQNDYN